MKMVNSQNGCPIPTNVILVHRLCPLIGKTITVYTPGFPELTVVKGKLIKVTSDYIMVDSNKFQLDSLFYIDLNYKVTVTKPYDVTVTSAAIGSLHGKLIRLGKDFVEFVQVPGFDVPTLFPLNLSNTVRCEAEAEE
jgi:hypothetical protein